MEQLVQVSGLSKRFSNFTAVDDLSFTVNKGDVYGFLGQNGAGKSTTIRMLTSLIQPTSGTITVNGVQLAGNKKQVLKNIGAVIEKPDLYKYMSAYENLEVFAKLSGVPHGKQVLMNQLEIVGLANRASDVVKTFSQGMKQRLGIAIALVHNPPLVILDEPTNGLDPQGIADVRNLILSLSKTHQKTVIVSSHLLSEIEQVATRILIIDKGKKLVEGNAGELLDPNKILLAIDTQDGARTQALLQSSEWTNYLQPMRENTCVLQLPKYDVPKITTWLVQQGVQIYAITPKQTLEDYFLNITSGKQHVATYTN
ncbi:MAG: ABC transporter ATP-binding protein [Bacteroidetes bacterium]|nr:MAG: ABC transporter ATP-binding protein [Bacteroidota bacterium]TAF90800.1 MAG: ABC transporter ATP-binding protein [Bacteroidota bacterium]